jgi:hypothetical protein
VIDPLMCTPDAFWQAETISLISAPGVTVVVVAGDVVGGECWLPQAVLATSAAPTTNAADSQ